MKRLNFFDLGMNRGAVCDHFLNSISGLNLDVKVIGFEAMPDIYSNLSKKYKNESMVEVYPYAISNKAGLTKIYSANCFGGHSIFKDHEAVEDQGSTKKRSFDVRSILFSDFIKNNFNKYQIDDSINILKSNIEGAEYYLFNDIITSGIYKKFKIFCGTPNKSFDVYKVKSLKSKAEELLKKMNKAGISFKRYTSIFNEPCPNNFNIIEEVKKFL
jgi:FkbM family methyltransferase